MEQEGRVWGAASFAALLLRSGSNESPGPSPGTFEAAAGDSPRRQASTWSGLFWDDVFIQDGFADSDGFKWFLWRLDFLWVVIEVFVFSCFFAADLATPLSTTLTSAWVALLVMIGMRIFLLSMYRFRKWPRRWSTVLFMFDFVAISLVLMPDMHILMNGLGKADIGLRAQTMLCNRVLELVLWYQVTFLVPRTNVGTAMSALFVFQTTIRIVACVWSVDHSSHKKAFTNVAFEVASIVLFCVEMAACFMSKVILSELHKKVRLNLHAFGQRPSLEETNPVNDSCGHGMELHMRPPPQSFKTAITLPEPIQPIHRKGDFHELFFTVEEMKQQLEGYADWEGDRGYKDVLLTVFSLLAQNLARVKGAAALFVVAPQDELRRLKTEPVDSGKSTEELAEYTVFHPGFARWLEEFSEHHEGDRGKDGLPTDGGVAVSHRSGRVLAAAVKFLVEPGSFRMKNHGMRHTAAADVSDHLRGCIGANGGATGATLVRSENGTISVFPAAKEGVVWRVRPKL